jgi:hypothetical protein
MIEQANFQVMEQGTRPLTFFVLAPPAARLPLTRAGSNPVLRAYVDEARHGSKPMRRAACWRKSRRAQRPFPHYRSPLLHPQFSHTSRLARGDGPPAGALRDRRDEGTQAALIRLERLTPNRRSLLGQVTCTCSVRLTERCSKRCATRRGSANHRFLGKTRHNLFRALPSRRPSGTFSPSVCTDPRM